MEILLYSQFGKMEMSSCPVPEAGAGEVLVKVAACGLCGSELEAFRSRSPRRTPPLVLGHEFCGEIAAVGVGVNGRLVGQKVVANALVSCGECVRCRRGDNHLCSRRQIFGMNRAGAFAEFVVAPADCLLPWPDGVPAEAACLAEPLGNGIHVVNLVKDQRPVNVLVIGGGPIGLLTLQALRALLGCTVYVADLNAARLELALRLGAAGVYNPLEVDVARCMRDITKGEGVDVVVDAVGNEPTKRISLDAVRAGGTAVWIGLGHDESNLNTFGITLGEIRVQGSYGVSMEELGTALELMKEGKVDLLGWTHLFPLSRGVEAFQRMLAAERDDVKAVLVPG